MMTFTTRVSQNPFLVAGADRVHAVLSVASAPGPAQGPAGWLGRCGRSANRRVKGREKGRTESREGRHQPPPLVTNSRR
jgi:hypothetical protein